MRGPRLTANSNGGEHSGACDHAKGASEEWCVLAVHRTGFPQAERGPFGCLSIRCWLSKKCCMVPVWHPFPASGQCSMLCAVSAIWTGRKHQLVKWRRRWTLTIDLDLVHGCVWSHGRSIAPYLFWSGFHDVTLPVCTTHRHTADGDAEEGSTGCCRNWDTKRYIVVKHTDIWKCGVLMSEGRRVYLPTYLLTYLLTYSMEQSPSWEANRFSASHEIPHVFWNPKVI